MVVVAVVGDRQARVRPYGVRKTERLVSMDHLRKIRIDVGGCLAAVNAAHLHEQLPPEASPYVRTPPGMEDAPAAKVPRLMCPESKEGEEDSSSPEV